jgi:hypothetical protein
MTRNKAYNIRLLCKYRGIDVDSLEAQEFKDWSILQLLNAIKEAKENPPSQNNPPEEEEDDESLMQRKGSRY